MTLSPFTRAFLLMFAGFLIWSVHFLAVYVFAALACARGFAQIEWLGTGVTQWAIGALTLGALAAVAAVLVFPERRDGNGSNFVRWTSLTVGLLSALSIVWQALPAYLVPTCA
jgi:hypothetical protein